MYMLLNKNIKHCSIQSLSALTLGLVLSQPAIAGRSVTEREFQTYQTSEVVQTVGGGRAELINLNPNIGSWYLLSVWDASGRGKSYHLQMVSNARKLYLDVDGLVVRGARSTTACPLFKDPTLMPATFSKVYTPICAATVYVRIQKKGYSSVEEQRVADARNLGLGVLVEAAKAARDVVTTAEQAEFESASGREGIAISGPKAASVSSVAATGTTGLEIVNPKGNTGLIYGEWYPASNHPGMFVSHYTAKLVPKTILDSYPDRVKALSTEEAGALVYLAAIDLSKFKFGYSLGNDEPGLAGSQEPTIKSPLATIGMVPPHLINSVEATFVGGFKRQHGRINVGPHAGKYYGLWEAGVEFSKLSEGLASAVITQSGGIYLGDWVEGGIAREQIKDARQNGVAVIEAMGADGIPVPGPLVSATNGSGNWSGDAEGNSLTQRSAICMQESARGKYLIFARFQGARPAAMARVFQAYGCSYAMSLDMNALMHTYFAMPRHDAATDSIVLEYLEKGMIGAEYPAKSKRFLTAYSDRDFFYAVRR
ncbi:MAG: hypothetical protein AAB425_02310 [Bdellovibrionota bacterium]